MGWKKALIAVCNCVCICVFTYLVSDFLSGPSVLFTCLFQHLAEYRGQSNSSINIWVSEWMEEVIVGRISQPINKIDFFPVAAFSTRAHQRKAPARTCTANKRLFCTEGKGCSRSEVQGLWSQMDLGSNPGSAKASHSLLNSMISLIYKMEIRLSHRVTVLGGLSNA